MNGNFHTIEIWYNLQISRVLEINPHQSCHEIIAQHPNPAVYTGKDHGYYKLAHDQQMKFCDLICQVLRNKPFY